MAISFESRGDWAKTFRFLHKAKDLQVQHILEKYGAKGVSALKSATPKKTGLTAASWSFEVVPVGFSRWELHFLNSNTNKGINIAFILQTGHGTGTGGYVQGIDYINPALAPVFQGLADEAFKEVTSI